ncbi:MAG: hypothetical protein AB7S26_07090 [Sandaracinaceae bacterium]
MAGREDSKFGTFGGVFTPSLLTILGVIMYMRLPLITGQAGLTMAVVIVLAAHVVSVSTGLSISSIATDRNVGAGGAYYMISRSLGLPIGGTLGLPLFLGLSFSISLYIIGFSENFLTLIEVPLTHNALRICGTITVILLTIITFISTSLAIKTQYVILALIGASLLSVFFGDPSKLTPDGLVNPDTPADPTVLFGIFFPAVTGFTAGVNMSGDLRDPKRAIPTGTMAAIGVGMAVYLSLVIFLGLRVPREHLVQNPQVLEQLAVFAPAVTAGIWGATLSSALGSILGAPRILQSVAADGIVPRWFARGVGPTNEPRNALLLAFIIGECGILIAELDAIARIVSIVFMTIYGFLNLAAAIESWVSPDFRPEFRIPKIVSVVGALTSLILMIQMDLSAMAGATLLMAILYVWLQRRQLVLESGDAWEGIWSSLVRAGLHRLSLARRQQRNWRPNILMFRPDDGQAREGLRRTAGSLITGNGMLTDVRLREPGERAKEQADIEEIPIMGMFARTVETGDPYTTMSAFAQFHGYSGLDPNTILIDWDAYADEADRFGPLIDDLRARDLNVLLFSDTTHAPPKGSAPRVDVWWRPESSPALGIALTRFIVENRAYRGATVRFLTVTRNGALADGLRNSTRRLLEEARLSAEVEVILDAVAPKRVSEHVAERSADAQLAIVELPPPPLADATPRLSALARTVPSVLYIAPGSAFRSSAAAARDTVAARERTALEGPIELPELELPELPTLATAAEEMAARLDRAATEMFDACLLPLAERNAALLDRTQGKVDQHFALLAEGIDTPHHGKRRRLVNRVQSALLMEYQKLIDAFVEDDLVVERELLDTALEGFIDPESLVDVDGSREIERSVEDFEPLPMDSRELARLKKKLKKRAERGAVTYTVDLAPLQQLYVTRDFTEAAESVVSELLSECFTLTIQLMRVFNASQTSMALIRGGPESDPEKAGAFIERAREDAEDRLAELAKAHVDRALMLQQQLRLRARQIAQSYADDLDRVDYPIYVKARARELGAADGESFVIATAGRRLYANQKQLFQRASVGLKVSAFQHRLATIVERTREAITLELKNGVLSRCTAVARALETYLAEANEEPLKLPVEIGHRFDPQPLLEAFGNDAQRGTMELDELVTTLSDEAIQQLSEGEDTDPEVVDLPLRRLAQFLVDAQLAGPLSALLAEVPALEERASGVTEDVIRLLGFHQNELDVQKEATSRFEHMRAVAEDGLARIRAAQEPLEAMLQRVDATIAQRLENVWSGTDVYELTRSARALGQHMRRHQGQRAVSSAQSLVARGVARARGAAVSLMYGQSAGLLVAQRLRGDAMRSSGGLDTIARLVEAMSPDPGVIEELPFYYRQLFFSKAALNDTFWVSRDAELNRAKRAVHLHERGSRGMLVVSGPPDSGKSALCRRITARVTASRPIYWIAPPDHARPDRRAFAQALSEATSLRGHPTNILAALPERSVLVIEDLELWFARRPGGMSVIEELVALVDTHGARVLVIAEISAHALRFLDRFVPLSEHALSVITCDPLPAEAIKEIVTLRHASTGMSFTLGGVHQDQLSDWREARLFSSHFHASRGVVGAALLSWIANIERADDRSIAIKSAVRTDVEVLDELKVEWAALLVQILLHKRITADSLQKISGLEPRALERELDGLLRLGIIHRSQAGILRLNRFVAHVVRERLEARRVLP